MLTLSFRQKSATGIQEQGVNDERSGSCRAQVHVLCVMAVLLATVVSASRSDAQNRDPVPTTAMPFVDYPGPSANDEEPNGEDEPDEEDCTEWDGQTVYCDVIDGTIHLIGTPDDENVHFFMAPMSQDDPSYRVFVLVTHSDGTEEEFEFDNNEILASAGIFSKEDTPADFEIRLAIDMGCGDDVVVNGTPFGASAKLGAGDDRYRGGSGVDIAFGQSGNDFIFGGGSQDEISGGSGEDVLNGGIPADNVFVWPGIFVMNEFFMNPEGSVMDGWADIVDCGKDADKDWVFAETFSHPDGTQLLFDSVIHRDWASPVGTDQVNP